MSCKIKGAHSEYALKDDKGKTIATLCVKKQLTKVNAEAIAAAIHQNEKDVS